MLRKRLCLLVALCVIAFFALSTAAAFASAARPAVVTADHWEPDDTTSTAAALSEVTAHTFTSRLDTDYAYVDVTATDTPIVVENTWGGGWTLALPVIQSYDPATNALTTISNFNFPFGTLAPNTALARAPKPGRYYIASLPNGFGSISGGRYTHLQALGQSIRVQGVDRYDTAIAVSHKMWPLTEWSLGDFLANAGAADIISPRACIVATGRGFADALAASAWTAKTGVPGGPYPILLTQPDHLNPWTAAEILRLAKARNETTSTFTVYIVGSTGALDQTVENEIAALSVNNWTKPVSSVKRLGGFDRFATASMIASASAADSGIGDTALIANGFAFPDALAAGPVAGHVRGPVLLVQRDAVPQATRDFLAGHPSITKLIVVGGPSQVATSVLDALHALPGAPTVTRVFGPTRYWTAVELARYAANNLMFAPISCVLATGENYPDGLSAAGIAGFQQRPLLLTPSRSLSSAVTSFYADFPLVNASYIVGGYSAVQSQTQAQFDAIRTP